MIGSAIWGLTFWTMIAAGGFLLFGPIEGVPIWRLLFVAGYGGFIQGLASRPTTELEELEEEKAT